MLAPVGKRNERHRPSFDGFFGHGRIVGKRGAENAVRRDHDLMRPFVGLEESRRRILTRHVPGVLAVHHGNGLLFRSDRRRLSRHAHHFIAHRPGGKVVDPRHALDEEARPGRRRAGALAE